MKSETQRVIARQFRCARSVHERLAVNAKHRFAIEHAMRIFQSDALYTFIPKNACSTLRFSIAVANGFIREADSPHWIHQNNQSFLHDTASAARSPYAFVILRCPFARLASGYLNVIAGLTPPAWDFHAATNRLFKPQDVSFRIFLRLLRDRHQLRGNEHWRPQVDFLLFETYDDCFRLEDVPAMQSRLEARIGLRLLDTRAALGHDTARLEDVEDKSAPDFTALECLNLAASGHKPSILSLFDDECRHLCLKLYADDFALYEKLFGKSPLMNALSA